MNRSNDRAGEVVGTAKILGLDPDRQYRSYICVCNICGTKFNSNYYALKEKGCPNCRKKNRIDAHLSDLKNKYVGRVFGELEILDIFMGDSQKYVRSIAHCRCSCGNYTDIPLNRILESGATTCGHNTLSVLEEGRKVNKIGYIAGSSVNSMYQKISKNNTSGYKGVSYIKSIGMYRAYITFRRKQYSLGCYSKLEDAAAARAAAEEQIFGNFVEWYNSLNLGNGKTKNGKDF